MPVETAADRAAFVNPVEFGVEIAWTLAAGGVTALNALFNHQSLVDDGFSRQARVQSRAAVLAVRTADLPAGHATGDSVSVESVNYTVKSLEPDAAGMTVVRLEKAS